VLNHRKAIATLTCLAAVGGSGVALAADGPTQITVQDAPTLNAGRTAPFDAPGVSSIRRGKAIPSGYVLVGQQVAVQRGHRTAGAALSFRCPGAKRLKTFGVIGDAGFLAPRDYVDHRQTQILSFPPSTKQQSSGTVYAVCR
jgi:hypothetical protein